MTPAPSPRSLSIAILLAAFIIAGSIWTRPAMGTKTLSAGQGDIGVVDIYNLVDIYIMSDKASDERSEFEAVSSAAISTYEQQLSAIQAQMATMSQDDPQAATLYNQYQQINQAIQQTTNKINADYQSLLATQIASAYKTIHAATNEVAADQGYTFVLATRRGADLVQTTTLTGVTQEILARPLVTPPEAADLTDAVRIHLGLPTMEEITAKIEAEQKASEEAAATQQAAIQAALEASKEEASEEDAHPESDD
ncbi:MAG: OmpH family outer membrane protein [Phycisphaerales bacterium]|nr:OmpH family outer membrane protein [Phycisphaerales bacterium]